MKKKLVCILVMSAMAIQLVACGSADVAKVEGAEFEEVAEGQESETQTAEAQETEAAQEAPAAEETPVTDAMVDEPEEIVISGYDFEGQYYAGKGNLSITYEGNDEFLIEVWWGIDAASHGEWVMTATYDPSISTLSYKDCVKHEYTLKDNGEVDTDETIYTDGTGTIKIVDYNTILWNDDKEHIADDVPMTR